MSARLTLNSKGTPFRDASSPEETFSDVREGPPTRFCWGRAPLLPSEPETHQGRGHGPGVRMAANDAELSRLHHSRPAGVAGYLPGAELVARNLENFSRDALPIVKELRRSKLDADSHGCLLGS